jgi:hypothetical protein
MYLSLFPLIFLNFLPSSLHICIYYYFIYHFPYSFDCICGLVVRVSGYRSRGPGVDSRLYQIFSEIGGLEQGILSLVRTTEELLE